MIIDVTPQVRKANTVESFCMKLNGQTEMYVFMCGNREHTMKFTPEKLANMFYNKTVSEMIVKYSAKTTQQITFWKIVL